MDLSLQQSDVIVLAETWIPERDSHTNKFELDNYESHLTTIICEASVCLWSVCPKFKTAGLKFPKDCRPHIFLCRNLLQIQRRLE